MARSGKTAPRCQAPEVTKPQHSWKSRSHAKEKRNVLEIKNMGPDVEDRQRCAPDKDGGKNSQRQRQIVQRKNPQHSAPVECVPPVIFFKSIPQNPADQKSR